VGERRADRDVDEADARLSEQVDRGGAQPRLVVGLVAELDETKLLRRRGSGSGRGSQHQEQCQCDYHDGSLASHRGDMREMERAGGSDETESCVGA